MSHSRRRPWTMARYGLWSALALGACALAGAPAAPGAAPGAEPVPTAWSGGTVVASVPVLPTSLRPAGEVERSPTRSPVRRRVRTRTRGDELLTVPRWATALPWPGAGGDPARTEETMRILRTRSTLVLSWASPHRDARSGVLHAHSCACPPPVTA